MPSFWSAELRRSSWRCTASAIAADPVPAISAARILAHTKILSSDEFEGRAPGSPGEEKTVAYLVSEFKKLDDLTSFELAKEVGYSDIGALTWNSASLGLTNLFVQEQSGAIFGGKHHLLINTPDGLAYRLPAGNLTKMFAAPMSRWVEDHGGTILRGAEVSGIDRKSVV